jgi:subtilisin family serine protease
LGLLGCALNACSGDFGETTGTRSEAASTEGTFIVLYRRYSVPRTAALAIERAGGTLVASYPAIGVAIARSSSGGFTRDVSADGGVEGVASTSGLSVAAWPRDLPWARAGSPAPAAPFADALSSMQWDMAQIRVPEAHAITRGDRSVVVGIFDSGIDDDRPDLRGQVDASRSVTCVGGVANAAPSSWRRDEIGHGTYVAGLIGAKRDGAGIVGVAPGATLAAVKLTTDGFVYPEAFICGLHWAATHDFDLVNASLFIDPWYYSCRNDPAQRTIWIAVQRAVDYATRRGTTVIAAASNENQDLAHPTLDPFSPTSGTPETREVSNACKLLPVELDGVIAISSVAADRKLASYSNYGFGVIDLTAPGGDAHVPAPGNASGQIVSDIPHYSSYYQAANQWNGRVGIDCTDGLDPNDSNADPSTCAETYALLQGTSAAAPHVTGIAALAISRFGRMSARELARRLGEAATPLPCPENPYQPYPSDMPAEICEGSPRRNGFYGRGLVDALSTLRGGRSAAR